MALSDTLFGSLGKKYCTYFYLLSVAGFFFVILMLLSFIMAMFSKKMDMKIMFAILYAGIIYGMFYLQNRILYSMCMHTENFAQGAMTNKPEEKKPVAK